MTAMEAATAISRNASEALAIMGAAGAALAAVRWPNAARKDFLIAFILVLAGTSFGQIPVYIGGMPGPWSAELVLFSGLARWTQLLGAVVYMRAALSDYCGPWGWRIATAAVAVLTVLI